MRLLIIIISLVYTMNISATIINIPADQSTIQAGIDVAAIGDTILVQPGTYYENINYNGKIITLASLFLTTQDTTYISQTIIDGGLNGSVITIEDIVDTTLLSGFTITNGFDSDGGGIFCVNSNPILSNLKVINNSAHQGGGIHCRYNSNPILRNILCANNSAIGDGGGIYGYNAILDLENVQIIGNTGSEGGGIYCYNVSNSIFNNIILRNNSAVQDGGGMFWMYNSDPILENVIIENNSAGIDGGGIYSDSSEANLLNITITGNEAGSRGGGILLDSSNLNMENILIMNNSTIETGGGMCCWESNPIMENITIKYNRSRTGGGIACLAYSAPIFNSDNRCSIYLNNSNSNLRDSGSDIYAYMSDPIIAIIDTFTVLFPTGYHAYPLENITFDILNGLQNQVNADLYVSPEGNNSNSGLNEDDPLKTIQYACSIILVDNLNPHTIFLSNGTYSTSATGEYFPVSLPEYVSLIGESENNVILDAEGNSGVMSFNYVNELAVENITLRNGNTRYGGGLYFSHSSPDLENITIIDNYARFGGGICSRHDSNPNLMNVQIINNSAERFGGGIYILYSGLNLFDVNIENNVAIENNGGGIYCEESEIVLEDVIILNNSTEYSGGGICIVISDVLLNNTSIEGNSAVSAGGGILFIPNNGNHHSDIEMTNVIINDNSAENGAGIYINDYHNNNLTLENATITNNQANYQGGGLYCSGTDTVLRNMTFVNNSASNSGSEILSTLNSDLIIVNSIIRNNDPYPIRITGYSLVSMSIAYSDIEGGESAINTGSVGTVYWLDGNIDVDPLFVDPENGNYSLTETSPCIDAGVAFYELNGEVVIDLAEEEYFGSAPDIGAYEWYPVNVDNNELQNFSYQLNNFPNPFNPSTIIEFLIQIDSHVELSVYNIKGQKIKTLVQSEFAKGSHTCIWNGEDDYSKRVSSGVYFCKINVNGKSTTIRKMLLLK